MQKSVLLLCAFTALNTVQLSIAADQKKLDSMVESLQSLANDLQKALSNYPTIHLSEESMNSAENILALLQSAKESGSLYINSLFPKVYVASIKDQATIIAVGQVYESNEYMANLLRLGTAILEYPSGVSKQAFDLLSNWYQEEQATKKDS